MQANSGSGIRSNHASAPDEIDPAKLPESLHPFIPMFEKWGAIGSDTARFALYDLALSDPKEMANLKRWHELYSRVDRSTFDDWLDGNLSESD